jgi:alpha-glucosidase
MFGQPELHDLYREWRKILDEYSGDRILCAEANVDPLSRMVEFVRPGEMHQTFNFAFMHAGWRKDKLEQVIDESLSTFEAVGAMPTWVLSNHDVVRTATRLGLDEVGDGVGPDDKQPNVALGVQRARAMALLMLALPGSAYLYQGEELGLGDNTQIPAEDRQDPSFHRSGGKRIGRDGCRVPLPWNFYGKYLGFSTGTTWLPLPYHWGGMSREYQKQDQDSTLNMYKNALELRDYFKLGEGSLEWVDLGEDVLSFKNGSVTFAMNMGKSVVPLRGFAALSSLTVHGHTHRVLYPGDSVWLIG